MRMTFFFHSYERKSRITLAMLPRPWTILPTSATSDHSVAIRLAGKERRQID